jgi:hypothetical protein
MAESPLVPAWRRYARAPEDAAERDRRLTLEAALGFTLATMIGVGLALLVPVGLFQEWMSATTGRGFDDFRFGGFLSLAVMVAALSGLGVGLVAFVLWRTLLVEPRRFGFVPGAQVGLFLALLLSIPLFLYLIRMMNDNPAANAPTDLSATGAALLLTALFAVPAGLAGAAVGGVIGSAQLREALEAGAPGA